MKLINCYGKFLRLISPIDLFEADSIQPSSKSLYDKTPEQLAKIHDYIMKQKSKMDLQEWQTKYGKDLLYVAHNMAKPGEIETKDVTQKDKEQKSIKYIYQDPKTDEEISTSYKYLNAMKEKLDSKDFNDRFGKYWNNVKTKYEKMKEMKSVPKKEKKLTKKEIQDSKSSLEKLKDISKKKLGDVASRMASGAEREYLK